VEIGSAMREMRWSCVEALGGPPNSLHPRLLNSLSPSLRGAKRRSNPAF
jgi:hypothetical protein